MRIFLNVSCYSMDHLPIYLYMEVISLLGIERTIGKFLYYSNTDEETTRYTINYNK